MTDQVPAKLIIRASDLLDLLSGAIIATGKDDSLPTLTGIYLESFSTEDDLGGLSATATDRWRLITGKTHWKGEAFTALLRNKDASEVIRALKPLAKRREERGIWLEVTEREITFRLPDQTFTFRLLDGTFPKYEHLLEEHKEDTGHIAVNPKFLGDFAKVPTGPSGRGYVEPVKFTFHGDSKLVTITVGHPTITWRGGIMPMRFNS
jgi:DNA polymerase III sliding clamp (beta) subunit (PCNA family)